MDGEVTAEQARELLDALVEGGGMKHIDTPLALRLIPLADDVGRDDLAAELMERAQAAATDAVEEGWVSLERLRRHGGDVDEVLALATGMEGHEQGLRLAAGLPPRRAAPSCQPILGRGARARQPFAPSSRGRWR